MTSARCPSRTFEIIWVSTQITQHKWGVGRVINRENITVGAHGLIFLQVTNARQFLLDVVAGKSKYTQAELEDWIFGIVSGVMRTQSAASTIRDLMEGQEEFARACGARLAESFAEWGITFKNLIINQFDVPEEYRQAIAQVTIAMAEKQRTIIQAEAAARLTTGGADVELMRRMLAMGLDPAKIKAVEALNKYAELAAQTPGGGRVGPTDMLSMLLFTQMARGLMGEPGAGGEFRRRLWLPPQVRLRPRSRRQPPPNLRRTPMLL